MAEQKPEQPGPTTGHERWRERRYNRGGVPGLFIGLLLIWLGISFFLSTQGIIPSDDWWKYFIIGLGAIFLIDSLIRYNQTKAAAFIWGRVIAGVVLIAVGLAFLLSASTWWPVILIIVGLLILLGGFWRRM